MSVRDEGRNADLCDATGKRMFATQAHAFAIKARQEPANRQHGDRHPMRVYHCESCSHFHIGHDRQWLKRNPQPLRARA